MYKNVINQLKDGTKIHVVSAWKEEAIKQACRFFFSTEGKTCEFVYRDADVEMAGYPTRSSLVASGPQLSLDKVDKFFDSYENSFLSVVSTDNYSYPEVESIWIPATLQKLEAALAAGIKDIRIYDINEASLKFVQLVAEDYMIKALDMINEYGINTSPISMTLDEKIDKTIATARAIRHSVKSAKVSYHRLDLITTDVYMDGLVDVSNIFVFPRNTWMYRPRKLALRFEELERVIGWDPDFNFVKTCST